MTSGFSSIISGWLWRVLTTASREMDDGRVVVVVKTARFMIATGIWEVILYKKL